MNGASPSSGPDVSLESSSRAGAPRFRCAQVGLAVRCTGQKQVAEEALKAGCGFIHRDSTDTLSQAYAGSDNWGSGPPGTAVSVG